MKSIKQSKKQKADKMKIPASEYKFGKFGLIDMKPCKARTKLLKHLDGKGKPVKVYIEAEIYNVWSGFDGTGQEFVLDVQSVKFRKGHD